MVDKTNAGQDTKRWWSTEASMLGLPPGAWPKELPTTLGDGQPFLLHLRELDGDELVCVNYVQSCGDLWLKVFND